MSITGSEQLSPISVEDYLAGELQARRKHEYVDGQIYAMVGGRYSHNLISTNVVSELHRQLKNSPCRALNSDSKVRVQASSKTSFYYPDVSVVCGDNIRNDEFQDKPAVVVEVLSTGTRRIDEGEKRQAYLQLDSLTAYIMIEQDFAAATIYQRVDEEFQKAIRQGLVATIELPEIAVTLSLSDVYANVQFQPETDPDE
jgi:Uma2 family endonuclease